ncbi:MAG: hypothetical protein BWY52_01966 [Chloroflexi bacterium ADurb.Bin325]|nr:MAG: hypothetical protein BWY52_01966 [Chloroflexi bacterium ADurb.Bin325]
MAAPATGFAMGVAAGSVSKKRPMYREQSA